MGGKSTTSGLVLTVTSTTGAPTAVPRETLSWGAAAGWGTALGRAAGVWGLQVLMGQSRDTGCTERGPTRAHAARTRPARLALVQKRPGPSRFRRNKDWPSWRAVCGHSGRRMQRPAGRTEAASRGSSWSRALGRATNVCPQRFWTARSTHKTFKTHQPPGAPWVLRVSLDCFECTGLSPMCGRASLSRPLRSPGVRAAFWPLPCRRRGVGRRAGLPRLRPRPPTVSSTASPTASPTVALPILGPSYDRNEVTVSWKYCDSRSQVRGHLPSQGRGWFPPGHMALWVRPRTTCVQVAPPLSPGPRARLPDPPASSLSRVRAGPRLCSPKLPLTTCTWPELSLAPGSLAPTSTTTRWTHDPLPTSACGSPRPDLPFRPGSSLLWSVLPHCLASETQCPHFCSEA